MNMQGFRLFLTLNLACFGSSILYAQTTDQFGAIHVPLQKAEGLTVVDFAASWCKPCLKSLPLLQKLSEECAKHSPGVRFLVISVDETLAGRDQLIHRTKVGLPVVWDKDHSWAEFYRPEGMPSLFIVDHGGKVIYSHTGFNQEKWGHFVEELLKLTKENQGSSIQKP